jgi:hypothetical protein
MERGALLRTAELPLVSVVVPVFMGCSLLAREYERVRRRVAPLWSLRWVPQVTRALERPLRTPRRTTASFCQEARRFVGDDPVEGLIQSA